MEISAFNSSMGARGAREVPPAAELTGAHPFDALLKAKVGARPANGLEHALLAADEPFEALLRMRIKKDPVEGDTEAKPPEMSAARRKKVRDAAEEFVSMSLVEPVLAKVRSMNMAPEAFAPGAHEKAFAPFMDKAWSMGIVKASGWGLVDRVEQWMTKRAAAPEVGNG